MELKDCIKKRRSIRNYKDREVSWSDISEILESARWAPAAGNIQSYKFIVIRDKERKKQIAKICHNQEWMQKAPVHIVVCSTLSALRQHYGERGEHNYSYQNTNTAIQNMLLTAYNLELGSCIVSAFQDQKLIDLLDIEKDTKPIAVITIGYPNHKPTPPLKAPLKTLVYFEQWGKRQKPYSEEKPFNIAVGKGLSKIDKIFKNLKKNDK